MHTPLRIRKRDAIKLIATYGMAASAGGLLSACAEAKFEFKSVDITDADYAKDFQLTDHNDQPRSLQDFQGKMVALFFDYTQCPVVCPTSLVELAEIKKALGA